MRLTGQAAAGLAQLVLRGGKEITDLVADMHTAISDTPWVFLGMEPGRAPVAYRIVAGAFSALASLATTRPEEAGDLVPEPPGWRRFLGVLNGVLGDSLTAWSNPLATRLSLRDEAGAPWALPREGRVILLAHGSCGTEMDWQAPCFVDWIAERRAAGDAVGYVRYNSGLAINENGRALSRILDEGEARLTLIGHSMGGLVIRSAAAENRPWLGRLTHAAYLGSPHLGAPLEQAGHFVTAALGMTPYSAPLQRAANVRSRGVKDLRRGQVTVDGAPAPLAAHVAHLALAGTLTGEGWLGDGMVTLASALGEDPDPGLCLSAPSLTRVRVAGVGHLGILADARVVAALREWLR